jgi:hypothetical protein
LDRTHPQENAAVLAHALDSTKKRIVAAGLVLVVVAGGAVLAMSGGGAKAAAPTTSEGTTTTIATTTTAPLPVAPLTGVAGDYGDRLNRPAIYVKIDNHEQARPQAGLNEADLVIEERVEGNITRLAAVFHSTDADPVGPVRSTRSTDIDLAALFGRPLYASSGGNDHILALLRKANVVDVGHNQGGAAFYRQSGRAAPHNLFTSTDGLRAKAGETPPAPAPIFTYRATGAPLSAGAVPAAGVALSFGGAEISRFTWDPGTETWLRSQAGRPHLDAAGTQVAPRNVVVLEIKYSSGGGALSSPHGITTGEGRALVFTAGNVIEGRWVRPGPGDPLQLLAVDGSPIALTPGQTFLELPSAGGADVL